jgi:hypothetical protein
VFLGLHSLRSRAYRYSHIYYLPFYFQAVKGTSAEQSGIRCIPYLVSVTVASLLVGGLITGFGPYTPFTWIGSALFCIGCGLLHTLDVDSSNGIWIGYQILAGFGAGACVQIPFIAVQVVLNEKDMPTGNAIAIFTNSLGGAVSVSAAQNIFSNQLVDQLQEKVPQIPAQLVVAAGATRVDQVVPAKLLPGALEAYNSAVTTAFILPIACAGVAFLVSWGFEWKSVKGKKLMAGGM